MRLAVFTVLILVSGCARLKTALERSVRSPHVLVPLVGASLVAVSQQDESLSDFGRRTTPLFDSQQRAERRSDQLGDLLEYQGYATFLLLDWQQRGANRKLRQFAAMEGGVRSAYWGTYGLKRGTLRPRPQQQDRLSFPSGHATAGAAWREVNERHLASRTLWLSHANTGLAGLKAWARVEAGKHYPTDVLAGYALGSFFTRLSYELIDGQQTGVGVVLTPQTQAIGWTMAW